MSDATSGNARAAPRPSTAPAAAAAAVAVAAATAEQRADIVTPADLATFQQQLRQEVADVIQQLRAEVNDTISGRMDMLNGINTALQNVSARPAESQPYRIGDLIPRNWEGSKRKGKFRSFMSHLWMQAWSDQGEQMLAMIESIDKFDNDVLALDCPDEEFRSMEASLCQVLHRTTSTTH